MLLRLPGAEPEVDESACIAAGAVVAGRVRLGRRVFVAPGAVLRADEKGSAVVIGDECNVQDGAVVHALTGTRVVVDAGTSLAHGCIVHGPCEIGRECFIGFRATVFRAKIGDGSVVMHGALVLGVEIPPGRLVPHAAVVDSEEKVRTLGDVPEHLRHFARSVRRANLELVEMYARAERV